MQDKVFKSLSVKLRKLSKMQKITIIIVIAILLLSCIIFSTTGIVRYVQQKNAEGKDILEYELKDRYSDNDNTKYKLLVKVNSTEGIETIVYTNPETNKEITINANGKFTVGIDYVAEDQKEYDFKIKIKGQAEKTETLYFEIPRIQGNYSLDDGIYVYEPDLTGYNANYTRYLDVDENQNIVIGNWINDEKPANWYNYSASEWANVYVEDNGLETYYVWIPRYCFKLDQNTERSDVKFIDVYNNYTDENGNITTWDELKNQGYQVPEAFEFGFTQIPGYWSMKYTAGESNVYTINFDVVASKTKVKISGLSKNTTSTIAKYTYAINGAIVNESITLDEFSYDMDTSGTNIINVTALDENGTVIGSMTKSCVQAKVNAPDLTGFDTSTTFYVTYNTEENETSVIPVGNSEPANWYDYAESKWANIVTRNNELEIYYVWIPRYEFKLDQTAQRSNINFLEGTSTETTPGYQIPEAFWWDKNSDGIEDDGEQLTGYWAMKYTAGTEAAPTFDTEVVSTSSSIRTKGITGTKVATGQVYNYYVNGEYKGQTASATDSFECSGLTANTKYTILVEVRNSSSNEYLGAVLKQITTIDANKPELTGFNSNCTYYVTYDDTGNETVGDKIKNDGSNMPSGWYDYSKSNWANIVVTDGTIQNGQISGATMTTYYTWIPRYEFMITSSQQIQPTVGRTEVRFLNGTSTDTDSGYQIPEAFTFDGVEIPGYWAMKYTAGE